MTRVSKIHLVDVARLTDLRSVAHTVARAQPFYGKKPGGWAYKAFRVGIAQTLSGAISDRGSALSVARGRGPKSCQEQNAIVAGYFYDKYEDLRGKADFLCDHIIERNGIKILINNIAIVETRNNIHLIYTQPRKNYCPTEMSHIITIKSFIAEYIVPHLDAMAPKTIFHTFDTKLPIIIEIFDAGNFTNKNKDPRHIRRYRNADVKCATGQHLEAVLDNFSQAYLRLSARGPSPKQARKPLPPQTDSRQIPLL